MQSLIEEIMIVGIHLGHATCLWHPKMKPYIYSARNGIHLIDLIKTCQQLEKAQNFVSGVRRNGDGILFVGTKIQAAAAIRESAVRSRSFFVNNRWLGGMLTNLTTIQASLFQLHRLEREQRSGAWTLLPKKKVILLRKRLERLQNYVGGLRGIKTVPGVVIVIGQTIEVTAIDEFIKLDIPSVCRLDTDCNPDLVKIGVPMNDDSSPRIRLFLQTITNRVKQGKSIHVLKNK
jgi:small subunit ribosomal protein S2